LGLCRSVLPSAKLLSNTPLLFFGKKEAKKLGAPSAMHRVRIFIV
jgi:hypothetical protein